MENAGICPRTSRIGTGHSSQNPGWRVSRPPENEAKLLPEVNQSDRWGAPVDRPGKIVCVGLNYSDHAPEAGMPVPTEPVLFLKAANTVIGPFDDIFIPRNIMKTDWEVELRLIIAREAHYLNSVHDADACIAGYCISHDVSEREFQRERGGQWSRVRAVTYSNRSVRG